MIQHSSPTPVQRIARLGAPFVLGLALLACGDDTAARVETGAVSAGAAAPAAASADALDRRAQYGPQSAPRSPDAVERWALSAAADD
jgi:hypothetical protein